MANQIEMSTAEVPAQNIFRQTFHLFGKAVLEPRKNTFSFADIKNNSNLPTQQSANGNFHLPGVNTTWIPFNETKAKSTDRAAMFITWPKQMIQKPDEMVSSGFYYTGCGDVVQCFYCGISLKHWCHTDSVNVEHSKHSPSCKFILMTHRK